MSPQCRLYLFLLRKRYFLLTERPHFDSRQFTEMYPAWFYEIMENDEARNLPYRQVLDVKAAGKTIVDIGTGPRVFLAKMSLDRGAKKIYAIEANPRVCAEAQAFVKANRLDPIQVIQGFSDAVELPEPCELLVHELVGSIGSNEGMALFIKDAKARFLKPDADFVPHACVTYLAPVETPRQTWFERIINKLALPLPGATGRGRLLLAYSFPQRHTLAEPEEFERIQFKDDFPLRSERDIFFRAKRSGLLDGFVFFIRLLVDERHVVDTLAQPTNWPTPYLKLGGEPTPLAEGDWIRVLAKIDLSDTAPQYSLTVFLGASRETMAKIGQHAWSGGG
jgi:hypothetical protein